MSDLYDTDILLWSEQQAGLLRRRAAGELVNDAELDWPNIAEEIESVGSEQRHAVKSLLLQALLHRLKAEAWPLSREVAHWRCRGPAVRAMRGGGSCHPCAQRIDMAGLYHDAVGPMPERWTSSRRCQCRQVCTVTLDELLADD